MVKHGQWSGVLSSRFPPINAHQGWLSAGRKEEELARRIQLHLGPVSRTLTQGARLKAPQAGCGLPADGVGWEQGRESV